MCISNCPTYTAAICIVHSSNIPTQEKYIFKLSEKKLFKEFKMKRTKYILSRLLEYKFNDHLEGF